jgi:hypothetical protein
MLQRYRSPAIHRALTGADNPSPIVISERQVRAHMKAVERSWLGRMATQTADQDHANAVAAAEDAMRVAFQRSTKNATSNIGVGYFNAYLKALERWAKLLGLDGPTKTELTGRDGGPIELVAAPLLPEWSERLDPREVVRRLRLRLEALERSADAENDPS